MITLIGRRVYQHHRNLLNMDFPGAAVQCKHAAAVSTPARQFTGVLNFGYVENTSPSPHPFLLFLCVLLEGFVSFLAVFSSKGSDPSFNCSFIIACVVLLQAAIKNVKNQSKRPISSRNQRERETPQEDIPGYMLWSWLGVHGTSPSDQDERIKSHSHPTPRCARSQLHGAALFPPPAPN